MEVIVLPTKRNNVCISSRRLAIAKAINECVVRVADAGEGAQVPVADFSMNLDSLVDVADAGRRLSPRGHRRVKYDIVQDIQRDSTDHPGSLKRLPVACRHLDAVPSVFDAGDGPAEGIRQVPRG